jgi:hypothetical protein
MAKLARVVLPGIPTPHQKEKPDPKVDDENK